MSRKYWGVVPSCQDIVCLLVGNMTPDFVHDVLVEKATLEKIVIFVAGRTEKWPEIS